MSFDLQRIRADFPVLAEQINGKPLVYLDSANSSQKPNAVIDAMTSFLRNILWRIMHLQNLVLIGMN